MHLPWFWRFRVLRAVHGSGCLANRTLLQAWARAEGGTARYNPLNTTQWLPGCSNYNTAGVKNFRTGADGVRATAVTLMNGYYPGIVRDLRAGTKPAASIVRDNAAEFDKWGTGAANVLRVLCV